MQSFAYVTENNWYIVHNKQIEIHQYDLNSYKHIGDIVNIAIEKQIYNIWIALNSELAKRFTAKFAKDALDHYGMWNYVKELDDNEIINWLKVWKLEGSFSERASVTFTSIMYENNLWRYEDDKETISNKDMLACLILLHDALSVHLEHINFDVPIAITPATTGIELLSKMNSGLRVQWLESVDLTVLPNGAIDALDIHWKKENIVTDKKYVHVFDRNASYLSSGNTIQVGTGTPIYHKNIQFDKTKFGLWYVTFYGDCKYNGIDLPLPFSIPIIRNILKGYYWTSEVELALMLGYKVIVHDAWLYPERHKVFSLWANHLWQKRVWLQDEYNRTGNNAYKLALESIKMFYTQAIGKLASTLEKKNNTFLRRDWRNGIISDARLKTMYRANRMLVEYGYASIMINVDALVYLSDSEDYREMLQQLNTLSNGIQNSTSLGAFKYKYSFQWQDVKDIFNSSTEDNEVVRQLNKLHRERG